MHEWQTEGRERTAIYHLYCRNPVPHICCRSSIARGCKIEKDSLVEQISVCSWSLVGVVAFRLGYSVFGWQEMVHRIGPGLTASSPFCWWSKSSEFQRISFYWYQICTTGIPVKHFGDLSSRTSGLNLNISDIILRRVDVFVDYEDGL